MANESTRNFGCACCGIKRVLPPSDVSERASVDFQVGQEYPFEETIEKLVKLGFKQTDMVTAPGEMSRRGGIIDLFPLTEINPLRIEFLMMKLNQLGILMLKIRGQTKSLIKFISDLYMSFIDI